MKKDSSGGKTPSKPPRQKIFGSKSLQIAEDSASTLVGSIVEKGISQNPPLLPPPAATVLPFPVARHRSHGPHWVAKGSKYSGRGCSGEEDEDLADLDQISVFATPVQRKQKEGLDFTQVRKVVATDNSFVHKSKADKHLLVESKVHRKVGAEISNNRNNDVDATDNGLSKTSDDYVNHNVVMEEEMSGNVIIEKPGYIVEHVSKRQRQTDTEMQNMSDFHVASRYTSNSLGKEQGSASLENEIDAENSARLQRMSTDEITEAQAQILEKMNPALIEALRKRGQDKLKKQSLESLNMATNGEGGYLQDEKMLFKDKNGSSVLESDRSQKAIAAAAEDTGSGHGQNPVGSLKVASNSLWDSWSERVEAVRELRFSLDGSIMEYDLSKAPKNGNSSVHGGYSANNVSERDFLRTEGDPGAAGYTIKEALALTRSVVPGQRALALHLLASVLERALHNICHSQVGCNVKDTDTNRLIDWEAIWAFALGPEPELSLSLRMSLDDNHNSVVLASAKVIQCLLCCEINESFFDISEKIAAPSSKDVCTAPVFRSRQEIDVGFLHGGFWKYSAKPSNILPFGENLVSDKTEGEHTIQDDVVIAGQDCAVGLVRMGILPRIRYLLETDPSAVLEDCIISILIAIARHSPTCANAIMKCDRLVQTVVDRFTVKDQMDVHPAHIKSVTLLKVLARSQKKNCLDFIKNGAFQKAIWHLYRCAFSIDQWVLGMKNPKLSLALIVEQLRFWKVCIRYGYCVSCFSDLFPALCLWLGVPSFEKLIENNILGEFAAVAKEAYLVLEALTQRLPKLYTHLNLGNEIEEGAGEDKETWCWSHVGPMVDLAVKWTALSSDPSISQLFHWQRDKKSDFLVKNVPVKSLLWVISAVLRMLSSVLERVIPDDTISLLGGLVPWLPEFVPKIGLELIRNRFFGFSDVNGTENGNGTTEGDSFIECLCYIRHHSEPEMSIASACCLDGLLQVVVSVDKLVNLAKSEVHHPLFQSDSFSRESIILANGILKSSLPEFRSVLTTFMKLVASEWHNAQSIEVFGRGGPAPGVGLGWGATGGGFWSTAVLLAQTDAGLFIHLLEIFKIVSGDNLPAIEERTFIMQKINSVFMVCSIIGPRDGFVVDKALDILFEVPVLKYLDLCIRRFLCLSNGLKLIEWDKEEDYVLFSKVLASHFKNRWLSTKTKSKVDESSSVGKKMFKKGSEALETIHEDLDTLNVTSLDQDCTSLLVEWAHQRLPLPVHWFLSPISTLSDKKRADLPSASDALNHVQDITHFLEVAKGGLFFLLGVEAMCSLLSTEVCSPAQSVQIIWKLHSLSMVLLIGMGVFEDGKSRVVYETLQEVYGQLLDNLKASKMEVILEKNEKLPGEIGGKCGVELLRFQSEIHESYCTFVETLVEQFAAVSYGDLVYGRQVAIYLHRCVEAPVRLAAWNALSNARVLELLPPLENCISKAEGYLEPIEDNESILEAYVKSWISGALDRAATRGSVTYTLVLHHLSSFIFCCHTGDKLLLQNKLVKSLLRDYSRKQQHEVMMVNLIQYKPLKSSKSGQEEGLSFEACSIEKRFQFLTDACEGNSSLLKEVEKLKSFFLKNNLL